MTTVRILFILLSSAVVILGIMAAAIRRSGRAVFCLAAFLAAVSVIFTILELYIPAALHLLLSAGSFMISVRIRKGINGISGIPAEHPGWKRIIPAALISASGAAVTVITIVNFRFVTSNKPDSDAGLQAFGHSIFNSGKEGFLLPLIMLAIIATAALLVYRAVKKDRIENKVINTGKKQYRDE